MGQAIREAAGLPVRTTSASMPAMAQGRALMADPEAEGLRPSGGLQPANPNRLSAELSNPLNAPMGLGMDAGHVGPSIGDRPAQGSHTPGSGTSQILSAEMVAHQVKQGGRGRLGAALAAAVIVLGIAGAWLTTQGRPDGVGPDPAASAAAAAAMAKPPVATPREKADKLLGEGLRLIKSGKADAALTKLRGASAADPTYGEPHLHQAALHAKGKAAFKSIASLEAFLGIEDDPDAVAGRIAADPDFGDLLGDKDFAGWLYKKGLRQGPPAELAVPPKAKPAKSRKKRRKKRRKKKQALEVPEF
jgi:hypothetical protein